MRSRRNLFKSSQFPVNGFGEASFNSTGFDVRGGGISGKNTGFLSGCSQGDGIIGGSVKGPSGFMDVLGPSSGFSGVFIRVSVAIVLISIGLVLVRGVWFLFSISLNSFSVGSDSSGAVW